MPARTSNAAGIITFMSRSTTTPLTFQSDLAMNVIIPGDPAGIPIMPPEGMGEANTAAGDDG